VLDDSVATRRLRGAVAVVSDAEDDKLVTTQHTGDSR
jgi:hypothetical protein